MKSSEKLALINEKIDLLNNNVALDELDKSSVKNKKNKKEEK